MSVVTCLPPDASGGSSDAAVPSGEGMDSDDRSSSSSSGAADGDSGDLIQCVSDVKVFSCRSSSVLPLEKAKDVRSFCSKVDNASVLPKGNDRVTSSSSCSVPVLKDSSSVDASLFGASGDPLSSADGCFSSSLVSPGASDALDESASLKFHPFSGALRGLKTFFSAPMRFIRSFMNRSCQIGPSMGSLGGFVDSGSCCSSTSSHVAQDFVSLGCFSSHGRRRSSPRSSPVHSVFLMSFFWIWLSFFVTLIVGASAELYCTQLGVNPSKDDFLKCESSPIRIAAKNNEYPTADFSNFTQEEFKEAATVKLGDRTTGVLKDFTGNFLAKQSELREIHIGLQINKNAPDIPQSFTLKNNLNLTTVIVSETLNINTTIKFTITGNKRLSHESIAHLQQLNYTTADSVIQDFGECDFESHFVPSFEDLDDCHYIRGDLVVTDDTKDSSSELQETISKTLKEIRGDLKITGTKLTSIKFTENLGKPLSAEIKGNAELCLFPEDVSKLKAQLGNLIYEENSPCVGECSSRYLMSQKDSGCVIIIDNLVVTGVDDSDDLKHLHQVKEIRGRLVITNNNFPSLDFFPNLETVDATSSDEDAIVIRFNDKMTFIDFPKLTEIKSTSRVFVYQNKHKINADLEKRLVDKYKDKVVITKEQTATIINATDDPSSGKGVTEYTSSGLSTMEVVYVSLGAGGLFILLILLCLGSYCIFIFVKVLGYRKQAFEKNGYKMYKYVEPNPELKLPPDSKLIVYPGFNGKELPWIADAAQIIKENKVSIAAMSEKLKTAKLTNEKVVFYQNQDAVAPFFSRSNAVLNIFRHAFDWDKPRPPPDNCGNEQCYEGCSKKRAPHAYCCGNCQCKDYGVAGNAGPVFGVRMEQRSSEWREDELEICHYPYFKQIRDIVPTVYEELFQSTAERMMEHPDRLIRDEYKWMQTSRHQVDGKAFVCGQQVKVLTEKEEKEEEKKKEKMAEKLRDYGAAYRFKIAVANYNSLRNILEEEERPVHPMPSKWELFKMFFRTPGIVNIDDTKKFLEAVIDGHMRAKMNTWVTGYTLEDFLHICELAKAAVGTKAYVTLPDIAVRIIGEVRGKFDHLRLCLMNKSVHKNEKERVLTEAKHVFLGNFIGPNGSNMEVICLLFALKARYPQKMVLLRGTLEWDEMLHLSGLKQELDLRFGEEAGFEMLNAIVDVFNHLPLACQIGKNVLCVHGGIAPNMYPKIEEMTTPIRHLVPDTLAFNMLFALPNYTVSRFFDNVDQKAGYYYGQLALDTFRKQKSKDEQIRIVFCSKVLSTGFGYFGHSGRVYSLNGYGYKKKHFYLAMAEFDKKGGLHIEVIDPLDENVPREPSDSEPETQKAEEKTNAAEVLEKAPTLPLLKRKAASAEKKEKPKEAKKEAPKEEKKDKPKEEEKKAAVADEKAPIRKKESAKSVAKVSVAPTQMPATVAPTQIPVTVAPTQMPASPSKQQSLVSVGQSTQKPTMKPT